MPTASSRSTTREDVLAVTKARLYTGSAAGVDPSAEIWVDDSLAASGWFKTELNMRFGILTRLRAAFRLILRGTIDVSFFWATSGESTFIDDIELVIGGE